MLEMSDIEELFLSCDNRKKNKKRLHLNYTSVIHSVKDFHKKIPLDKREIIIYLGVFYERK